LEKTQMVKARGTTFVLVVRQTFLRLHVVTFTDTFIARSYAEASGSTDSEESSDHLSVAHDSTTVGDEGNREGATELRIEGGAACEDDWPLLEQYEENGSIE